MKEDNHVYPLPNRASTHGMTMLMKISLTAFMRVRRGPYDRMAREAVDMAQEIIKEVERRS